MKKIIITEEQFREISQKKFHNKIKDLAKKLKVDLDKISFEDFKDGVIHEMEHGSVNPKTNVTQDNLLATAKIALAHLEEDPDYYKKLATIEEKKLTKAEKEKMASYEKNIPIEDFKKKYGDNWKNVYYGTITNLAKKNA